MKKLVVEIELAPKRDGFVPDDAEAVVLIDSFLVERTHAERQLNWRVVSVKKA